VHFQKKLFFPNLIVEKKKRHFGATINTIYKKFQNISFENSFQGKHVSFAKKDPKKNNTPKCKVNILAHCMSFGSNFLFLVHHI
jgi:hypothetical protein